MPHTPDGRVTAADIVSLLLRATAEDMPSVIHLTLLAIIASNPGITQTGIWRKYYEAKHTRQAVSIQINQMLKQPAQLISYGGEGDPRGLYTTEAGRGLLRHLDGTFMPASREY